MEREFFNNESINTRLAREAIQNSLDAASDPTQSGPVRMRFSFAGVHSPLPAAQAAPYLDGLIDPLKHSNAERLHDTISARISRRNLAEGGVPFLVIEDADTQGLDGDWTQFDDSDLPSGKDNHFFWFFRNTGRSGKGDADNGSWGLGKWVFPDASRINSYIAVTRRRSDDKTLLMGQSILTKHTINGQRHEPYGYLGVPGQDKLLLPLVNSDPAHRPFVERCIADFDLRLRNQPGLSLIIPFPRVAPEDADAISAVGLLTAIVHNYFYPLIAGRLEVTVDAGDCSPPVEVTASTIDSVVNKLELQEEGELSADSYAKLFKLCRESIALPAADYTDLAKLPGNDPANPERDALVALREPYRAGQLLAFRVHGNVQRKGDTRAQQQPTEFRLYLQRDDSLPQGQDYYVRGTLSIPNRDHIQRHRAWALLRVDEGNPLAAMLRDSEPAAHTSWRPQTQRVQERWVAPSRRIQAVLSAPVTLLNFLEAPPEGLQKDAFSDIFFWDGAEPAPPKPEPTGIREKPAAYDSTSGSSNKQQRRDFGVARVDSGFRVTLTDAGLENPPAQARLQVAYEIIRGNPLKSYHPEDFRLHGSGGALTPSFSGCQVKPGKAGNELLLDIDNPEKFQFTVTGFDRRRDLHVRVEAAKQNQEASDVGA